MWQQKQYRLMEGKDRKSHRKKEKLENWSGREEKVDVMQKGLNKV